MLGRSKAEEEDLAPKLIYSIEDEGDADQFLHIYEHHDYLRFVMGDGANGCQVTVCKSQIPELQEGLELAT